MRKILLVALLVMLPMSAYALEPISEKGLGDITAQEGVRITIKGSGTSTEIPTFGDALEIHQKAVSTAWTNDDGVTETGIVMKVTQTNADEIFVKGDLTIQAATADSVSSVTIGLPEVVMETGSKKTEIFIGSRATSTDSNFIADITDGQLGTQYAAAGMTHILAGGSVAITSMD